MENWVPLINTVILIIIFFYQRNRNKVLQDRISEQTKLLGETKSVVGQQATAINSQSTIVDSAIKYGEAFNVDKLEDIIRRQVVLEKDEEIKQIEKKYEKKTNLSDQESKEILEKLAKTLAQNVSDVFQVPTVHYIKYLETLDDTERQRILSEIDNEKSRHFISSLYGEYSRKPENGKA